MLNRSDSEGPGLGTAIDKYDAEVLHRGSREIKISAEQAWRSTHWEAYLESAAVKYGMQKIP